MPPTVMGHVQNGWGCTAGVGNTEPQADINSRLAHKVEHVHHDLHTFRILQRIWCNHDANLYAMASQQTHKQVGRQPTAA